jgi:hypothetical protein
MIKQIHLICGLKNEIQFSFVWRGATITIAPFGAQCARFKRFVRWTVGRRSRSVIENQSASAIQVTAAAADDNEPAQRLRLGLLQLQFYVYSKREPTWCEKRCRKLCLRLRAFRPFRPDIKMPQMQCQRSVASHLDVTINRFFDSTKRIARTTAVVVLTAWRLTA